MTLLVSKRGDVGTLEYWQKQVEVFWEVATKCDGAKKPEDAFERYAKIIGLKPAEQV